MQPSAAVQNLTVALDEARTELNEAQTVNPTDPTLIAAKRAAVEAANKRLSEQFSSEAQNSSGNFLSSQLTARITSTRSRIDLANSRLDEIRAQIESLQGRIAQTPDVCLLYTSPSPRDS